MNSYFTKKRGHTVCFCLFVVTEYITFRIISIFFFIKNTAGVEEGAPEQKILGYYIFNDMQS